MPSCEGVSAEGLELLRDSPGAGDDTQATVSNPNPLRNESTQVLRRLRNMASNTLDGPARLTPASHILNAIEGRIRAGEQHIMKPLKEWMQANGFGIYLWSIGFRLFRFCGSRNSVLPASNLCLPFGASPVRYCPRASETVYEIHPRGCLRRTPVFVQYIRELAPASSLVALWSLEKPKQIAWVPRSQGGAGGPMKNFRYLMFLGLFSLLAVACRSEVSEPTSASQAIEAPQDSANATTELSGDQELSSAPEQTLSPEEAAPVSSEVSEPDRHTFVLIGGDLHRLDRDMGTGSFVIVTGVFPKGEEGDIVLIDVPRDLYVPISCQDGVIDRIVAAYPHGIQTGGDEASGIDCVRQVVEDIFGLEVNSGVALVTGDVFESLVDSFGGLEITPGKDHQARCSRMGYFNWSAGEKYHMNGDIVKCYLKVRNRGAERDLGRSNRAGQVVTAMANQWLPLYVEHPVESIVNTWQFWKENINLSLNLAEIIRLAPLIPKAQDAEIRSARFHVGEDVTPWTSPQGDSGLQPAVDLKEWTVCAIASPSAQELLGCSATASP